MYCCDVFNVMIISMLQKVLHRISRILYLSNLQRLFLKEKEKFIDEKWTIDRDCGFSAIEMGL